MYAGEKLISKPQAIHNSRSKILEQDVTGSDDLQCSLFAVRILEVQGDTSLSPIESEEGHALTVDIGVFEGPVPLPIAVKRFNLDYIRAHIGEHLGGIWSLNELTEICDSQSL
jgi:hypothetical protein